MLRPISCCLLVLAAALAGCGDEAAPSPIASASPDATAAGPAKEPAPRQVAEETELYLFEYSWPERADAVPALAAFLEARQLRQRQHLAQEAQRGLEAARANGFPYNKYSLSITWEVEADLPGWISLAGQIASYSGGAHPNYGFDTLVWDKERDVAVEPIAFFTSAEALDEVLGEALCEELNRERERRRGQPVPEGSSEPFDACVGVNETNVSLGSASGRAFDRIGIHIAPYLAGPYAEGNYEFSFPITAELLEVVRPEYRGIFAAGN